LFHQFGGEGNFSGPSRMAKRIEEGNQVAFSRPAEVGPHDGVAEKGDIQVVSRVVLIVMPAFI
jgi:hypothetical protein